MKAAILEAVNKLTITQQEIPECGPGEVLIKTKACGICRTDLKCFTLGQRDLVLPRILGHEVAGIVEAVGQGVTQVSIGERVQVSPGIPCGECSFCLSGQDNLCDSVQILGFHLNGGFAEYLKVPAHGVKHGILLPIPDHVTYAEAALTEPLACSVNMQHSLSISPEDTLLIFGAGPLGILNAKLARDKGVKKIILCEKKPNRLKLAEKFDFDYVINSELSDFTDLKKEINKLTLGKGVDVCIPCCPGIEAFRQGIDLLAKRGRLGFFSGLIKNEPLDLDLNNIHYKELMVSGSYGCSLSHNKQALELIAQGRVQVDHLITKRLSLDELHSGFEMVQNSSELSIVIEF